MGSEISPISSSSTKSQSWLLVKLNQHENVSSLSLGRPKNIQLTSNGTVNIGSNTYKTQSVFERVKFKTQSKFEKMKLWIFGNPIYSVRNRKYCGGRLPFPLFVAFMITLVVLIILVITVPVVYCITIPSEIQRKFDATIQAANADGGSISIKMINATTNNGLNVRMAMKIPPLSSLSGVASLLGPTVIYMSSTPDGARPWANLRIPGDINVNLNKLSNVR